jgi:AcrR family transcriptional regulator
MTVPGRPDTSPRPIRVRREPPLPDLTAAVLDAILRRGVDRFTLADIEQRTSFDAATVRRQWGDKAELAVRALSLQWESEIPLPDTGNICDDLTQWAHLITRYLSTPGGRWFMRLVVDGRNWGSDDARAEFSETRYQRVDVLFARAQRRGGIRPGVDMVRRRSPDNVESRRFAVR